MKGYTFYNLEHMVRYLNHCVVRFNGDPVYVTEVTGRTAKNASLIYYHLNRKISDMANWGDEWDLTPFPLGYINYGTSVVGLYRKPLRCWKVGLTRSNCFVRKHKGSNLGLRLDVNSMGSAIHRMVHNDYPTYEMAVKKNNPVAFSRLFCVDGSSVYYSRVSKEVGRVTEDGVKLSEKHSYLQQLLTKAGAPCAL